jgi:hypothetical protein
MVKVLKGAADLLGAATVLQARGQGRPGHTGGQNRRRVQQVRLVV